MGPEIKRRTFLKVSAASASLSVAQAPLAAALAHPPARAEWVIGKMSGARAVVRTLLAEGVTAVFGIPGAQENELWDEFKQQGLPYLLAMHEFSASAMADGFARSTGRVGVCCVVPGPGITNTLTGLGEALLDSVPVVCLAGDVARGENHRAFQVHDLPQADLLRPVCKEVISVTNVSELSCAVRRAIQIAQAGEPGPVGLVIPYDLLAQVAHFESGPLSELAIPFDASNFEYAVTLLSNRKWQVGIYAGQGCFEASALLVQLAELLQAPVATTISGKGVIDDRHQLAVGWGYGAQGTRPAELAFKEVDLVLAIGAKFGEVPTAFFSIPEKHKLIHVDINKDNLGRNSKAALCVESDAGIFLSQLLSRQAEICRPANPALVKRIAKWKESAETRITRDASKNCVDPVIFLSKLRALSQPDALVFMDVSMVEHWSAEFFRVYQPRTYFNPADNQSMGWSIPAALGAQFADSQRQVISIVGDGCFMMSGMELANACRAGLPIKVFLLDNQAYHYMQVLQKSAYSRSTATNLPRLDYRALAAGFGIGYLEILSSAQLCEGIQQALHSPGPMLVRLAVDYGERSVRWIEATKDQFIASLSAGQKARFAKRLAGRALNFHAEFDD